MSHLIKQRMHSLAASQSQVWYPSSAEHVLSCICDLYDGGSQPWVLNCGSRPLWSSHIRYPVYYMFAIHKHNYSYEVALK